MTGAGMGKRILWKCPAIFALFMVLCPPAICAWEKVENVRAMQAGDKVYIYYDLMGDAEQYEVKVRGSSDGGRSFSLPMKTLSGDVGSRVVPGLNKKIVWDVLKDTDAVEGEQFVFEVMAERRVQEQPAGEQRNRSQGTATEEKARGPKGWLGVFIQKITPDLKEKLGLKDEKGALVADVVTGGPANKAGIKRGEVIVSFDGKEVKEVMDLPHVVSSTPVGRVVRVEVIRKGERKSFDVKMGELIEGKAGQAPVQEKPKLGMTVEDFTHEMARSFGMTVEEITPELAKNFGISETRGLIVAQVDDPSPAAEAGIKADDVILEVDQKGITDIGDFNRKMTTYKSGDTILFLVKRTGSTVFLILKVPKQDGEKRGGETGMRERASESSKGKTFTNSVGIKFVYFPPGTFVMGSPAYESGRLGDEAQHHVTLTKGFSMGATEVTQGQWKKVMGTNPSHYENCGGDCPMESVSWNDVHEFIRKLNEMEKTDKYRLPTEAEWEYACRAGSSGPYAGDLNSMGWYGMFPLFSQPRPVAQKKPNAWGLYDMHGNVDEWCEDWWGEYPSWSVTDPKGPNVGRHRVMRGGAFVSGRDYARCARRGWDSPEDRSDILGFRLVRDE
jgi:formylglycine-generating enzyme required for sulfatase activity